MGKKGIADPLADIKSSFLSFQNQLTNACKFTEIVSNSSLKGLAGVLKKYKLAGVSKNINDSIFKPSEIIVKHENKFTLLCRSDLRFVNKNTDSRESEFPPTNYQCINDSKINYIINSPLVDLDKKFRRIAGFGKIPIHARDIPTKSLLATTSSIQLYRSISISRSPIIPPLVAPDEFYSPLPNPFPRITTDEVHERSVPLEEDHAPSPQPTPLKISQRVLIVGGSSDGSYNAVARIIRKLGLQLIVFDEQPNGGWTSVEKLEAYADIDFVTVLLTPDDIGASKHKLGQLNPRACQNVISRLGYLWGALGRDRICILRKGDIELPSDIDGWIHESMDGNGGWQLYLAREMKYAGLTIDQNKLI